MQAAEGRAEKLTNESLRRMGVQAGQLYEGEDFPEALEALGGLVRTLSSVPRFDPLLAHYAREVHARYSLILPAYCRQLEEEVESRLEHIFPAKLRQAYLLYKKSAEAFAKMSQHARRSKTLERRKPLWQALIREKLETMDLQIYMGKK